MSELKVYGMNDPKVGDEYEMYKVSEVDAVLAEKDAKIHELENMPHTDNSAVIDALETENEALKKELAEKDAEFKQKLEDAKATAYAESVDAGMRERRLKRALYKACANWALSTLAWLDSIDQGEPRKWSEMVQKCRAKAEEYK